MICLRGPRAQPRAGPEQASHHVLGEALTLARTHPQPRHLAHGPSGCSAWSLTFLVCDLDDLRSLPAKNAMSLCPKPASPSCPQSSPHPLPCPINGSTVLPRPRRETSKSFLTHPPLHPPMANHRPRQFFLQIVAHIRCPLPGILVPSV